MSEVAMMFLPRVVRAKHEQGFRICLTFNDGTEGVVDCASWLTGPVFEPLRDVPSYFARFFLDGGTVAWPNGADIAPETLYEATRAAQSNTHVEPTART
jgi:hypothetical protein